MVTLLFWDLSSVFLMSIQLNILLNVALFQSYREDVASLLNLLFKPLDQKRPNAFQKKKQQKRNTALLHSQKVKQNLKKKTLTSYTAISQENSKAKDIIKKEKCIFKVEIKQTFHVFF